MASEHHRHHSWHVCQLVVCVVIVPLLLFQWFAAGGGASYLTLSPTLTITAAPATALPATPTTPARSSTSPAHAAPPPPTALAKAEAKVVAQAKGGPGDPHFHITWNDYASTSGRLRVVSAAQDHRRFAPRLASVHPLAFPATNQLPHARLFQFHVSHAGGNNSYGRTTFWIYSPKGEPLPRVPAHQMVAADSKSESQVDELFVVTKLEADCINHQPRNWDFRIRKGSHHSDIIVRCIVFLPPEVVDQALCIGSFAHAACRIGHVVVHDVDGGMLRFPMDKIMHFPNPVSLFSDHSVQPTTSFPTAPWRAKGLAAPQVKRAAREARARTCAWVPKKYSWDAADELWLLWMLDIVDVDFVAIYLVPSNATGYDDNPALFNTTTTLDAVRKSIGAHPGVSQRVLLIQSDIPGSPITYEHMVTGMHWDGFVRLQADCDYGFSIDTDEFVELFDSEPPHERVDVRTFIAQRANTFDAQQSVFLPRLRMKRITPPGVIDETMAPFFVRWLLHLPIPNQSIIAHTLPREGLGKSFWKLSDNLQPYLHFPDDIPAKMDDLDRSRILHVRLQAGFAAFNDKRYPNAPRPQDLGR